MTKTAIDKIKDDPFSVASDPFFTPIGNTKPFFKAAFEGFAGSGKTYTSALCLIGLYKQIESKKPIIIFDTETSSKFLVPLFAEADIPVIVKESRSLADLKITMQKAREGATDILFIDSISHVWENFLESYMQKKNRTFLQFQDWGVIKPTWRKEFSDPFVRDPYHCFMTGRAGYEYEQVVNEDTNRKELQKSGVKMRVEGDTAYEPDLLVLMSRMQEMSSGEVKKVSRVANIIKDRSDLLDGKTFENPTYDTFKPVIDFILKNPVKQATYAETDAASLVKTEEDRREWTQRRDIALEKIEGYLTTVYPGQGKEEKLNKTKSLEFAYGTLSWIEISKMSPDVLETGMDKLREYVANQAKSE